MAWLGAVQILEIEWRHVFPAREGYWQLGGGRGGRVCGTGVERCGGGGRGWCEGLDVSGRESVPSIQRWHSSPPLLSCAVECAVLHFYVRQLAQAGPGRACLQPAKGRRLEVPTSNILHMYQGPSHSTPQTGYWALSNNVRDHWVESGDQMMVTCSCGWCVLSAQHCPALQVASSGHLDRSYTRPGHCEEFSLCWHTHTKYLPGQTHPVTCETQTQPVNWQTRHHHNRQVTTDTLIVARVSGLVPGGGWRVSCELTCYFDHWRQVPRQSVGAAPASQPSLHATIWLFSQSFVNPINCLETVRTNQYLQPAGGYVGSNGVKLHAVTNHS